MSIKSLYLRVKKSAVTTFDFICTVEEGLSYVIAANIFASKLSWVICFKRLHNSTTTD